MNGTANPGISWLAPVALGIVSALALAQAHTELGFTTKLNQALAEQYARKFGPPVPDRFRDLSSFARQQKEAEYARRLVASPGGETVFLQVVNDAINTRMKWVDDQTHWGAEDYWATPAESRASAGGDCEDFSIAKYYLLKELGVPMSRLRITYVRALKQGGQAHMVLTYYARPDAEPLVLDNIETRVLPASRRGDLEPVYTFNDDEVQLVRGRNLGAPSQIRAWVALQARLVTELKISTARGGNS